MSIIEKAAGRLDRVNAEPAALAEAPSRPSQPRAETTGMDTRQANTESGSQARGAESVKSANHLDIDLGKLQLLGLVTPDGGRTAIAEEFRHIKRPLIENAFHSKSGPRRHRNLIMVTSSMPGEGKTFCSINLAMSMAMELDHTVLLVDADVARPSIPRFFGLEPDHGLLDLLHNDKIDVRDVMYTTNVERLRLLPAGKSHKRATELLASQAMNKLLGELANRYPDRIIIFDSPPVLLTSEARTLASQMGQIVLVVEAESTTQHSLKDTLRQLGSHENVSLVYNKARAFSGKRYYGGYY